MRQLSSHDVADESAPQLRDRMGWSETPQEDACAVIMRLCDIIAGFEQRLVAVEHEARRAQLTREDRSAAP